MYHLVLILLAATLIFLGWMLVHSVPRILSMLMPSMLTFYVGAGFMLVALFGAFFAAYGMKSPEGVLGCFVQVLVGLWLMCVKSSAARGSEIDEQMLKRVFAVLGMIMMMIIANLYLPDPQLMSLFNLVMIGGGLWVATSYLRLLDRGS